MKHFASVRFCFICKKLVANLFPPKLKQWPLILAWGSYDLANQFFALNVVSFYFALWVTKEKQAPEIFYSLAFGLSTFAVALAAPLLGAVSDASQRRQPFLRLFTIVSVLFTIALARVDNVVSGLVFFAIANFGCQAAIVFYNALMVNITPPGRIGLVSGLGKMMGYLGALLGLYLVGPLVLRQGYQAAFLPTGILFLIFALPCMILVKDKNIETDIKLSAFWHKERMLEVFRHLRQTWLGAAGWPGLVDFFKAAFFGLCVVNVLMLFMSVYATKVFAMDNLEMIKLLIFSTCFAMIGSFVSGYVSDRLGYKLSFIFTFILWIVCLIVGALGDKGPLIWVLGGLVGICLAATWVVSRVMVIKLAPPEKIGELFGLFNLLGYFAAITGSLFWGILLFLLSPWGILGYRLALFSLTGFLVAGLVFAMRIPEKEKGPAAP